MEARLQQRGVWRIVSGERTKPSDDDELRKWEDDADEASGEIYLCCEHSQQNWICPLLDHPVKMWEKSEFYHP